MNLYDYPELKEDLESLIKREDDIPLSICQFGSIKAEELCKTFLSECHEDAIQEIVCDLLEDDSVKMCIAKHYTTSDGFGSSLESHLYWEVSEIINDMLEQVNVKKHIGDYYD